MKKILKAKSICWVLLAAQGIQVSTASLERNTESFKQKLEQIKFLLLLLLNTIITTKRIYADSSMVQISSWLKEWKYVVIKCLCFVLTKGVFTKNRQETDKDLKTCGITGRPSVIFHRYHEANVTKIKGKYLCKKVIGLDANALYLSCVG